MFSDNIKIKAAGFSIASALGLAVIKLIIAVLGGSMAVMASAIDSILDILMSGVNFMAIRQAEQPPDENHPFGHGKFETLATLFQSLVITCSGLWIIYEAITRLSEGKKLERIEEGIGVLAFSAVVSWVIAGYLSRVAKKTDSSALEADSLHFRMDIYTNLGLMAGLLLIRWFAIAWLDSALSILVALYILREALQLIKRSLADMLDHQLPEEFRLKIESLIASHAGPKTDYHDLRTRRAGSMKIMDFHLELCKYMTIEEAHQIGHKLENKIEDEIPNADVIIHFDPCANCDCPGRDNCAKEQARIAARGTSEEEEEEEEKVRSAADHDAE
jgi:cation diffusion facilitator family transporter